MFTYIFIVFEISESYIVQMRQGVHP